MSRPMSKQAIFLAIQSSCACFVITLFCTLGALLLAHAMKRESQELSWNYVYLLAILPAVGLALAALSLRAMQRCRLHRSDARLAKLAFVLNMLLAVAFLSHRLWLVQANSAFRRGPYTASASELPPPPPPATASSTP